MRRPNHIVLDFEYSKSLNSSQYWATEFLLKTNNRNSAISNLDLFKKYKTNSNINQGLDFLKNQQQYTLKLNTYHEANFLRSWEKDAIKNLYKPDELKNKKKPQHLLRYSKQKGRDMYVYLNFSQTVYDQYNLKYLFNRYNSTLGSQNLTTLNTVNNLININFLRKERLYTKLKYSRSPAFDIVSGGAAALLAGFIGFLISEKFGYELADSGDFYYLFMYIVFLSFSLRPLLIVSDANKGFWDSFNLKRVINFYVNILKLLLTKFK